jgi:hypothetical protein
MTATYATLFGNEGERFLNLVVPLVSELRAKQVRYSIMSTREFETLLGRDMPGGMKVYWLEILGRAHFAAAASVIRSFRWCEGMCAAYDAKVFLPYCASLRGLVESVADTYDALNGVAVSLAENHAAIDAAVRGCSTIPTLSGDLEDALIHFAYAHKPAKGVDVPTSHIAKTVADYLKPLAGGPSGDVKGLYGELCQFTHPAAHSVQYMCVHEDESSFVLVGDHDEIRIEGFAKSHANFFPSLFMLAFNAPVLLLKVLSTLPVPPYHVEFVRNLDLGEIPAWRKISQLLGRDDL